MEYLKLQNLPAFYEGSWALKRNGVATQTHPGQYRPGLFLWNAGLKFNAIYFLKQTKQVPVQSPAIAILP